MNLRLHLANLLGEVNIEVSESTKKHGEFASAHEGYAVILEELDELKEHVWKNTGYSEEAYNEAKQIAAMGVKFMQMIASRQGSRS